MKIESNQWYTPRQLHENKLVPIGIVRLRNEIKTGKLKAYNKGLGKLARWEVLGSDLLDYLNKIKK